MSSTARYSRRYGYNDNYRGPSSPPLTFDRFVRAAARAMREIERANRAAAAAAARAQREAERRLKEAERAARRAIADEKARLRDQAKQYAEARLAEAIALTADVDQQIDVIRAIIPDTLKVNDAIDFDSLRRHSGFPAYQPPDWPAPGKPLMSIYLARAGRPFPVLGRLPYFAKKHEARVASARKQFSDANEEYTREKRELEAKLLKHKSLYDKARTEHESLCAQHRSKIADFEARYKAGDQAAIQLYCEMVMDRSEYDEAVEPEVDITFADGVARLTIRACPSSVIPAEREFSYVKSRDEIKSKSRSAAERAKLYELYACSVCLRTVHELLEADVGEHIQHVELGCHATQLNRGSGQEEEVDILQLKVSREAFLAIDLQKVDPVQCVSFLKGT